MAHDNLLLHQFVFASMFLHRTVLYKLLKLISEETSTNQALHQGMFTHTSADPKQFVHMLVFTQKAFTPHLLLHQLASFCTRPVFTPPSSHTNKPLCTNHQNITKQRLHQQAITPTNF